MNQYPENNLNDQEETNTAPEANAAPEAGTAPENNTAPETGNNPQNNFGQRTYEGQPPYGQPPYGQPPYGQPPYGQPPYGQPPVENPGKALGIAGFVLSLCSFVGCFLHAVALFGLIILGMVLSIVGRSKSRKAGCPHDLATAGMVISIVHLALWILLFAFLVVVGVVYGAEILSEYAEFYTEFAANM